jgi:arabinofuranan 3-O-arabinosyltransferase
MVTTATRPGREAPSTRRRGHRSAVLVAVIFIGAIAAAHLLPQWGVLTPDTKPELYLNPSRMLGRETSAWRPVPHLGSPNYHPGIAPVTALVRAMQALGMAPWFSQRLLAILLTLLGAAGAAVLVRQLVGRSGLVAVTAGIAYAVHPYAVVAGATLPIRLPHAVLPWFVLAGLLALSRGGWRWPAATALAYAAMGGINGGIVNLLLALSLPVVAMFVLRTEPVAPRLVLARLSVIAGLCVLVSLYWLIPTLLAAGSTGTDVAATTEAPEAVAGTSSPIESLRGLGMWTLYLVIGGRPEVPGHIAYLSDGWLAAASLGLPVLAAIGVVVHRSRARLLGVGLVLLALPIMVGLHPPDRPSPFGRLLAWSFQHVPGAIGFRTPNKIGSLLALGIAILVGLAVAGRWRSRSLAPLGLGLVALAAMPLWVGNAQPVILDVPAYWHDAAAELDTDAPGRLLFAPGGFLARYGWGYAGVDDLDTALFDERDVVWRPTVPAGSRPAHNVLTAFDVGMNTSSLSPEAAAAYLSLLGVSDVLVRADSGNTADGAATAASLLETYAAIEGAELASTWGPQLTQSAAFADPAPPTAALSLVSLPTGRPWDVTPLEGNLVLTGDAFAIGNLADAGYQPQDRSISWFDELSEQELVERLAAGGRIVATDTNQRRRWDVRGLDRSHSIVLGGDDPLPPTESRARSTDRSTQTTATIAGGTSITSSDDDPSLFRVIATNPPSFAADGDPTTTWLTGAFNTEEDSWIRLDHGIDLPLDRVRIEIDTSLDRVPSLLRVTTEAEDVVVDVPRDGEVSLGWFSESSWIRVDVLRARGEGPGPIGITDISVAGRSIRTGMELPPAFERPLAPVVADSVAVAPLDVVLTRMQGDPASALDDEERNLLRDFTLPDERTMSLTATVRPRALPDDLLDAVALEDVAGSITSDTATEAGALGRATQAFDGDPATAWRPLGPIGQVTVTVPTPVPITDVMVQREAGAEPAVLRLQVGPEDHEIALVGPRTTFRLPTAVLADELTLTVATPDLEGQLAPVSDIRVADVTTASITASTRLTGCVAIGTMDGAPVGGHVDASVARLVSGQPLTTEGCEPVQLGRGRHRYDAGLGWQVDQVVLRSDAADAPAPRAAVGPPVDGGTVRSLGGDRTSRRLEVSAPQASVVSTGIAWDPRWRASIDDRPLGPPVLTAGYAVGWVVPAGEHELTITYGPQRLVVAGMFISGFVVLVLSAVVLTGPRSRP